MRICPKIIKHTVQRAKTCCCLLLLVMTPLSTLCSNRGSFSPFQEFSPTPAAWTCFDLLAREPFGSQAVSSLTNNILKHILKLMEDKCPRGHCCCQLSPQARKPPAPNLQPRRTKLWPQLPYLEPAQKWWGRWMTGQLFCLSPVPESSHLQEPQDMNSKPWRQPERGPRWLQSWCHFRNASVASSSDFLCFRALGHLPIGWNFLSWLK